MPSGRELGWKALWPIMIQDRCRSDWAKGSADLQGRATLNVTARFTVDERYLQTYWADWIRSRSRFGRFSFPVDCVIVAGSVFFALLLQDSIWALFFVFTLVLGLLGMSWDVLQKKLWFHKRRLARQFGAEVEVTFTDDHVVLKGPLSVSTCDWAYFAGIKKGVDGIYLLVPEKGFSVYVPYGAISPKNAIAEILAKDGA